MFLGFFPQILAPWGSVCFLTKILELYPLPYLKMGGRGVSKVCVSTQNLISTCYVTFLSQKNNLANKILLCFEYILVQYGSNLDILGDNWMAIFLCTNIIFHFTLS